jgi:Rhamnan synthesis protein F
MPPFWKVYRELDRTRQMLHAMIGRIYEPFVQRAHDRKRDQILQVRDGHVPLGQKVALLLIYQPKGVSPTVMLTCRHLVAKGYAPMVVSNTPLSDADLAALAVCTWKTILRPNYGYDFGGYRDGILWLQDRDIAPERLMILNDSIWFPVWPEETLIERMEALPADLAGAVIHPVQRRRKVSALRPAFIESYFYIANRPALQSAAFREFWQGFRVSSIKYNAVYRGERSFSHFLERGGLTARGIVSPETVVAAVAAEDDEFLAKTLTYGAYTDPEFETERDALMVSGTESPGWRASALAHVTKVAHRRSAYASFPYPAFRLLDVPFVKKSRLMFFGKTYGTVQIKMRTQLIRAIKSGDLPMPLPEVFAEITASEKPETA